MKRPVGTALAALTLLPLTGCATSGSSPSVPTDTVIDQFGTVVETIGPNGEEPTRAAEVVLTDEQAAAIAAGGYRAAIAWHEVSGWSQAIQAGIEDEFAVLGVEIVSVSDAKFDAALQANQIETAISLEPDVILGQAVDPTTAAAAYQPAVDRGIKLVFADQAPDGYSHGDQFQAILTDDLYQIGERAGIAMCDALGGAGEVAVVYYDADFHVTNFRDASFLSTLARECPDVAVVAKVGFTDPNRAEEIASALLLQHPNLSGIYTSWAVPAQGVLGALKNAGNTSTRIVTVDLDDTIAADLAVGGNVAAIVADRAYDYGRAIGRAGALALLGELGPEFGVSDAVTVTADTLVEGYSAWNQEVPAFFATAQD